MKKLKNKETKTELRRPRRKQLVKNLRLKGRTGYNDYFDQIEIMVNNVEETEVENQIEDLVNILEA
jgi:hypothetical protein